MVTNNTELEKRLWDAADQLRANSELKSSEYAVPVLGLIFLRFADYKFGKAQASIEGQTTRRRKIGPTDYHAQGVVYVPDAARYDRLLKVPESDDLGQRVNEAMEAIEGHNPELSGVLPKAYARFGNRTLATLLKSFNFPLNEHNGDMFGRIYEYFLEKFAMSEGRKGGEFFTPGSVVKLIVEIIEPYQGRIYDPACGSGGMFVWSAEFVEAHQQNALNLSIYGQERVLETVRLAIMNLAVHGLPASGIVQANSYYDDNHDCVGRFDYVMANPPFNVDGVDKSRIKDDTHRFPLGMPNVDNGNYLWIQLFYSALNDTGRAGFVMANSASDARHSELEIRRQLIEDGVVDVMVAVGSNFFYTVTLPCTLWFLDKGKRGTERESTVLFIDARGIYTPIDRAHREFAPEQLEFLANIARLYRGLEPETRRGSADLLADVFPDGVYQDVAGLCKVATVDDIAAQGWSLNPGRYVGVADRPAEDFDFAERLEELHERLELLNLEAHELEERISENTRQLLEGS
jgi:type I restriction enzyme M protein